MPWRWGEEIFEAPEGSALVVPVNCVPGVMGAGLARAFADQWPELKQIHFDSGIQVGSVFDAGEHGGHRLVFFPTKRHWRMPSSYRDIEHGLGNLADWARETKLETHIPALGCGLGQLRWVSVGPHLERWANHNSDLDLVLYAPRGVLK